MNISFEVNGIEETVEVEPGELLLDTLRNKLHLTGTKNGCREGECGACTVLVDGKPVNSCIYSTMAVKGLSVETIEGVAGENLSCVQSALIDKGGIQCGFCTPGFVMTITALLRRDENPSTDTIRSALSGNICRCTGYSAIVASVKDAAAQMRGADK